MREENNLPQASVCFTEKSGCFGHTSQLGLVESNFTKLIFLSLSFLVSTIYTHEISVSDNFKTMKHSLSTHFTLKLKVKIHSSNYLLSYNYVLTVMLDTIFFFYSKTTIWCKFSNRSLQSLCINQFGLSYRFTAEL